MNTKTKVFTKAAALITAALIAAVLLFTACRNSAGGNSGSTGSSGGGGSSAGGGTPSAPPAVQKYAVSFGVDGTPANGTLTAKADGIAETEVSPITVEHGTTVTFTATPASGYEVEQWTNGGAPVSEAGTSTTYSRTVTANADIKVKFKALTPPPTPPAPPADKTYTVGSVNFTMKGIAAVTDGTVGHSDRSDNKPHTVSISAYLMGETEVTQELWQKVMGTNPSHFQGSGKLPASSETQDRRPVEKVSWFDCIAFCNELTKKVPELGASECVYTFEGHTYGTTDAAAKKEPDMDMSKKGFRLPTEAEWEWAAKGGTENTWAGTNDKDRLKDYAWYANAAGGDATDKTHQVKLKHPNGYGLYDMSGNVYEWCWDRWYAKTPTGGQDPTGDTSGTYPYRVFRGGGLCADVLHTACAFRAMNPPNTGDFFVGFRVACRL